MKRFIILIVYCLVCSPTAQAQNNIRITDIAAQNYGDWVSGGFTSDDPLCVSRDHNTKHLYKVTVTDDSTITPGSFALENPPRTSEIPYEVNWKNSPAAGGTGQVDGVSKNRNGANLDDEVCGVGGLSANINIVIDEADIAAVPAAVYTAELTLFVEPR